MTVNFAGLFLRFILFDSFLQVVVFLALAKEWAGFFERRQLLLGVGKLIHVEVKLAHVFVSGAVIRIELQSRLVILHGLIESAELAVTISEESVSIGVLGHFLNGFGQVTHGSFVILRI